MSESLSDHTIHIAIGNTDNGLTQQEWAAFYAEVDRAIASGEAFGTVEVFGRWASFPIAPYQNAGWALAVSEKETYADLRLALALAAKHWRQQSIAWNESVTEFIAPLPAGWTRPVQVIQ